MFRDDTTKPAFLAPLSGLEVSVRGFTTRMFTSPEIVRFSLLLEGGAVPIGETEGGNMILGAASSVKGAASDTAALLGGGDVKKGDKVVTAPIFQELAVKGSLAMYPRPTGRVETGLAGLELQALKGVAAAAGVELRQGMFDGAATVFLSPRGPIETSSKFVFTDLALSEPPDGPIVRYLHLPAPLDSVLFVLRDADESIKIPLRFTVKDGEVGSGQIASAAVSLFGELVGKAIASSPFRIVGGVANLAGLKGGTATGAKLEIPFSLGSVVPKENDSLKKVATALRDNPQLVADLTHSFGTEDIVLFAHRANPTEEDAAAMLQDLRRRERALLAERKDVVARANAAFAAHLNEAAEREFATQARIDRELGQIAASLDEVAGHLRKGAERYAERRTRAAALTAADARLEAVRAALLERGIANGEERVRIKRPRFPKPDTPPESEASAVLIVTKIKRTS